MINVVRPHPGVDDYIEHATKMAVGAQMTYRGGPLLSKPTLVVVFLGDEWANRVAEEAEIAKFNEALVTGTYLDALSEYRVGRGSFDRQVLLRWESPVPAPPPVPLPPPTPVPTPPPPQGCLPLGALFARGGLLARFGPPQMVTIHAGERVLPVNRQRFVPTTIDDAEIRLRLNAAIADGRLPAKTPETLYMVYVQPGVSVTLGADASCSQFCGYHDSDGAGLYYGVIPYPTCSGCTGPLSTFQALTSVTSHEIAEAVTDPIPGTGWYNDAAGEIGDPCAWSNRTLDGYTVQLEWLNSRSGCG